MVELKKINKYFSSNGVKALDGADFNLREGEIHVLLGENGAGKSTLMHIMAGFLKPGGSDGNIHRNFAGEYKSQNSPGAIFVNGKEKHFSSPAHSLDSGIGMIHQHPHQIPGFTVWENCITGSRKHPPLYVNRRKFRKQVSELNERLNFGLPLDSPTENLSVSQGQKAAILTLLLRDTQYLIFDEPTAVLSPLEAEKLFKLLAFLRDEGRGIVFISHKLEEALKIASRVTILRQGKTQICCKPFEISDKELYKYIFGAESFSLSFPVLPELHSIPKKNVLALENFQVNYPGHPLIRGINLEIRPGTIMGITGVRDSGLETLELAITGYLPFKGKLNINGKDIDGTVKNTAKRIKQFRSAGACYLGQGNEGEFLPIRDLLLIHSYRHFLNHGILNIKESNRWVESVLEAAKVPHKKDANAAAFSGGQMQRLLLTREMAVDSALMVLSEPSHSLDLRYRQKLASILREKAGGQTAVIIFSTDVEELIKLSDTIAVLRDGVVSAAVKLQCRQNEKEIIQAAMVGKA